MVMCSLNDKNVNMTWCGLRKMNIYLQRVH